MNKKAILCLMAGGLVAFSCVRELEGAPELTPDNTIEGFSVQTIDNSTKSAAANGGETLFEYKNFVTTAGDTICLSAYLKDMESPIIEETKGAQITDSNFGTYTNYTQFTLYAYLDNGGVSYTCNNGNQMGELAVSKSNGKWGFSNGKTYSWPNDDAYLNFVCIAPSSSISDRMWDITRSASDNSFYFTYKTNATFDHTNDAIEQEDLLLAFDRQNINTNSKVAKINFKHALMGIQFQKGTECNETITAVGLTNFSVNAKITMTKDGITYSNHSTAAGERYIQNFAFNPSGKSEGTSIDDTQYQTKTFMFIPQNPVSNKSDILIYINSDPNPLSIQFTDLAKLDSKLSDLSDAAGKLIVFRINKVAKKVAITVNDTVNGFKKSNITMTNTGNCPIYVRAAVVGSWVNDNRNIICTWVPTTPYGKFDNSFPSTLPGNWTKHTDGYYYYKKILPVGYTISQNLFSSFELTSKPAFNGITKFEMSIIAQAVEANTASAKEAWGLTDANVSSFFSSNEDRSIYSK